MANYNLKDVVRVYGDRLKKVVEAEEKKHGPGALVISVKKGLDVSHVPKHVFKEAQAEIFNSICKCEKDGDVFVLFNPQSGNQEIGVLSMKIVQDVD